MSRLSWRITKKPRSASSAQKSSCQATICVPRPMISRIAGSRRVAEGLVTDLDLADVAGGLGHPSERSADPAVRRTCWQGSRCGSIAGATLPVARPALGGQADRAADAGAAQAAVAVGHLREVLLVVVLGVVELAQLGDLGRDLAVALVLQALAEGGPWWPRRRRAGTGRWCRSPTGTGCPRRCPGACPVVGSWFSQKRLRISS